MQAAAIVRALRLQSPRAHPAVLSRPCVYVASVADLKAAWGVRGSRKSPIVRDAGIVTDMLGPVSVTMLLVRMRHGLPLPPRARPLTVVDMPREHDRP